MFGPASIPPHDVECAVPEGGLSGTGPPRGKYGKLEVPVRPSLAGFTSARGLCRGVLPGGSRTMHCVCQSSTARCPPKLIQRCRKVGMETEITRGGTQEIGSISDAAAVSGGVRSAHRLHRAARAIGWRDSRESILCVSATRKSESFLKVNLAFESCSLWWAWQGGAEGVGSSLCAHGWLAEQAAADLRTIHALASGMPVPCL